MTFATNTPGPVDLGNMPLEQRVAACDGPELFWAACDHCNRALPGPGFTSETAAAAAALAAGWLLRPRLPLPVPEFITAGQLFDCAELFCPRCATEFET
jgi:hypothetical protein